VEHKDSRLLAAIRDAANERIDQGEKKADIDFERLICDCIRDFPDTHPEWQEVTSGHIVRQLRLRSNHAAKTARHIKKRYAEAFRAFDMSLAAAELVNIALVDAFHQSACFQNSDELDSLWGMGSHLGGITVKSLLLIGMHARLAKTASEVSLLLQSGLTEGAGSRLRTMYELLIKAEVIMCDESPSRCELAERYYVSALVEASKFNSNITQEEAAVFEEAQRRWGSQSLAGENNWAIPILPSRRRGRVTFRDLERHVSGDYMRHMYLESNVSVHAGALQIVQAADFKRRNIYDTRSKVDLHFTGRIGHVCSFLLQESTIEIVRSLAQEFKEWDLPLQASQFLRQVELANRLFRQGYLPQ
jgi:hypothetical protein